MNYVKELRALVGTRPLILVGAVVLIGDDQGNLLLEQRQHPYGKWGLPGGLMELGETTEEAARREVREETGLAMGTLTLEAVYSGPSHYIRAANGDEIYCVTIAYSTAEYSGELQLDPAESLAVAFVDPRDYLAEMTGGYREIVEAYLAKI